MDREWPGVIRIHPIKGVGGGMVPSPSLRPGREPTDGIFRGDWPLPKMAARARRSELEASGLVGTIEWVTLGGPVAQAAAEVGDLLAAGLEQLLGCQG